MLGKTTIESILLEKLTFGNLRSSDEGGCQGFGSSVFLKGRSFDIHYSVIGDLPVKCSLKGIFVATLKQYECLYSEVYIRLFYTDCVKIATNGFADFLRLGKKS